MGICNGYGFKPSNTPSIPSDDNTDKKTTLSPIQDNTRSSNEYLADVDNSTNNQIECDKIITQNIVFTSDLDCVTDGMIAGADGITINLNGFTLSGPGEESSKVGIMFADNNKVTIQGPGTIKNFQAGALLSGGEHNHLSQVTFTDNEIAVFETNSTKALIEDNLMLGNSIGIASHSSSGSKMSKNTVNDNELSGMTFVNSRDNIISENIIQRSINGVFLDGQSTNNEVSGNTVRENQGIDLNNGNGLPIDINKNKFTDNICNTSNPDGLCVQ